METNSSFLFGVYLLIFSDELFNIRMVLSTSIRHWQKQTKKEDIYFNKNEFRFEFDLCPMLHISFKYPIIMC